MIRLKQLFMIFLAVTSLTVAVSASAADEFCWRDSYGRGVGVIPTGCGSGQSNDAGLCYNACRSGFHGVGPVCWSSCPAGYTDMGATCHINLPLTRDVEWECSKHFPKWLGGKCATWKTTCPSGYTNVGLFCALDSAGKSPPSGFTGTYLDPMKTSYGRGAGTVPQGCEAGKQYDAGLCYTQCRPGYKGAGPVCWGQPPSGWGECGMGAAKTSVVCGSTVFSQVSSVGQLAFTVATFGGSAAATEGANAAEESGKLAQLEKKFEEMKKEYEALKKTYPQVQKAEDGYNDGMKAYKLYAAGNTAANAVTAEDLVRMAAQIASIVDTSGVSATVAAYTYPKCSVLFK